MYSKILCIYLRYYFLFVSNIINYFFSPNQRASKTGLVDASPESQKALRDEIEKIGKQYGASASAEFPNFNFTGKIYFKIF